MIKENLLTMAKYLANLPSNYDRFGMGGYCTAENEDGELEDVCLGEFVEDINHHNECGSTMCVVGHVPLVKEFQPIVKRVLKVRHSSWLDLSYQTFFAPEPLPDVSERGAAYNAAWVFMFDYKWTYYNDTPLNAAKRLVFMSRFSDHHEFYDYMKNIRGFQTFEPADYSSSIWYENMLAEISLA